MTVLAVDLGKTGCRVGLWHGGYHRVAEGHGAPGLAECDGATQAEAAIVALASGLMHDAGLARLDAAGIGAAGAWTAPGAARDLAQRLVHRLPAAEVWVASDAIAAHLGALGGQPGVVLAVGTGAVAVAVGPDGDVHRIDGLGPWLGDEGGGASIGLGGLRAALRARERRGPATLLVEAAERQFGPLPGLASLLAHGQPARIAAAFAPAVASAAAAGDAVAHAIMADAATALLATVRAARARLPPGRPVRFALVGGLAALGAGLTGPLLAALDGLALTPVAAPGSALDGARRLATAASLYGGGVHHACTADAPLPP